MTRTLKDRLWKRGLNPHLVQRSRDNLIRAFYNMRGLESLEVYRDYVRRNPPERKSYAVRMARAAVKSMREVDAKWRAAGGYLP